MKYTRVRNKRTPILINCLTFFQGLRPYYRAYLSNKYKELMGLSLVFSPTFPGAIFIQGGTFIPGSRVANFHPNWAGLAVLFSKQLLYGSQDFFVLLI